MPSKIRDRRQYVAWKKEQRPSGPTKVPIDPNTGRRAASDDPRTWGALEDAIASDRDGVGYMFGDDDELFGVDLDGCINAEGVVHPDAVWSAETRHA
jgi:primase-polymerase (primpol)-like protein